ncbi:MAG TPA: hypothetical protein VHI99_22895 [Vicinamibacterales bacterium]|nr:hypothetical protein [Vicinamibacterales bacterium]
MTRRCESTAAATTAPPIQRPAAAVAENDIALTVDKSHAMVKNRPPIFWTARVSPLAIES